MKSLLASLMLSLCATLPAYADNTLPSQVLKLLVENAGKITLVDGEGKQLPEELQLSSIIADQLTGGYLSAGEASTIKLSDATVTCKDSSASREVGAVQLTCRVVLVNGDFAVNENGFVGPDTESGVSFDVQVSRAVTPNAKLKLKSTVIKASLAG